MAGNSFGNIFKLSTFGESHGKALGGVIDGCPAGVELDFDTINKELNRRRPGQSEIATLNPSEDKETEKPLSSPDSFPSISAPNCVQELTPDGV